MFTGLVEEVGTVGDLKIPTPDGGEMTIHADAVFRDIRLGDNIAVNGTCLTVTWFDTNNKIFKVGIPGEILKKTCVGRLGRGSLVNLERSLQTCTRMRGHVDAVGMVRSAATPLKKGSSRPQVRWTERMDQVLVQVLLNKSMTGGKRPDNTWKADALDQVVMEVNKFKFGPPIVTKNVRFRLKTLKKEYRAAKKALNQSGFSYNHESGCIEADEHVWEAYIQAHPEAASLRSRMFPNYTNLAIICGNERATGPLNAEGHDIPILPITSLNGMESSPATASKKGGDRSNVRWTEPMDKVLIQVLFNECVTGGKRSDNTWKPEALNHVVTEVNKIKFGTPVVTKNVRFRLKTLKKEYRAAKKALNQSGFSYNHESGCIEADEQVWDEYIKAHPDAAPLRSRKFPYYKNLAIICGNEQPPGYLNFEGNNISPLPITTLNGAIDDGAGMNLDEDMSQIHGSSSTSTPPKVTTTPQKRKRNRAAEEKIKVSFEALAEAAKDIANSFRPVDFAGLNAALRVLPGLSSEDRLRALDMFAEKKELAAIFFGFEEELRLEWLRRKLS